MPPTLTSQYASGRSSPSPTAFRPAQWTTPAIAWSWKIRRSAAASRTSASTTSTGLPQSSASRGSTDRELLTKLSTTNGA